ncbi:MAG: hypothetical protein HKN50_13275, partial [Gammaproteobacteria bacterium]|nr:hypothetical protein [Gammaproteobacteria bacterium]
MQNQNTLNSRSFSVLTALLLSSVLLLGSPGVRAQTDLLCDAGGGVPVSCADPAVDAADIATDAVSADELNATGVEAELEAVLDLNELQGAVTDAQVPNNITIDLATTVT